MSQVYRVMDSYRYLWSFISLTLNGEANNSVDFEAQNVADHICGPKMASLSGPLRLWKIVFCSDRSSCDQDLMHDGA